MTLDFRMLAEDLQRFAAQAPLGMGYRFELLERDEIRALTDALAIWYGDISVGAASCYLDEHYYERKVFFPDAPEHDAIVLSVKQETRMVGMFSCELNRTTQSVYAGLGVAAPGHRGANLAQAGMKFSEAVGRHLNLGFVYGMATLKHPYAQRAFERAGWQLVGIIPGFDRELVAPGVVQRVYEAIYAKVLEANEGLQRPKLNNLTPQTRQLFESLFSSTDADGTDSPARAASS